MKIYLVDQKNKFKKHLNDLKGKGVKPYDQTKLTEKITTIDIDSSKSIDQLDLDFFFNYHIFPGKILTFRSQWEDENRKMKIGDTIVQQAYLPPIKSFSQKIIFGVRINNIIEEKHRKGFSYETLDGHIEEGISSFIIQQEESKLVFKIHPYSSPGNLLTRLVGPIISVPYQTFCTKSALSNVNRQIEK